MNKVNDVSKLEALRKDLSSKDDKSLLDALDKKIDYLKNEKSVKK